MVLVQETPLTKAAPLLLTAVRLALLEFERISYQKKADGGVLAVLKAAAAKAAGKTPEEVLRELGLRDA